MKKPIAALTALLLFALIFTCAVPAGAKTSLVTPYSLSDGIEKLRSQFEYGKVGNMDYRYFTPCDESKDTGSYPLVVFCHGIKEGYNEGDQINRHYFANWSSLEYQRRFAAGGAYILMPRSPQDNGNWWASSTTPMVKAIIDDFVKHHNVDTSRIYIGGFSIGGRAAYQLVDAYPNFFAAAIVMSPYTTATAAETNVLAKIPVWFFGCNTDTMVNYTISYKAVWDEIVKKSEHPEACRFTTFTRTVDPDGNVISNNHETWHALTCEMHTPDGKDWPYCSTVDGTGKPVTFAKDEGVIAWLNGCARTAPSSSSEGRARANVFTKLLTFFRRIISLFTGLFR